MMQRILLFDIDGTLLRINRPFMQKVIFSILDEMNIPRDVLSKVSFAGNTDTAIFRSILKDDPHIDDRFQELKRKYIKRLKNELTLDAISVFEQVENALKSAQEDGYPMGLLTGNFEQLAYHKLGLAGLDHYFSFGAFGSNHHDRNKLGPIARQAYEKKNNIAVSPEQFVIIGDTPRDIACARAFGCSCAMVTTGNYSREELAEKKPDLIIDRLTAPRKWITKL